MKKLIAVTACCLLMGSAIGADKDILAAEADYQDRCDHMSAMLQDRNAELAQSQAAMEQTATAAKPVDEACDHEHAVGHADHASEAIQGS